MTVNEKIDEAERWLEKVNKFYLKDWFETQDNVNAFLCSANSIPDHLLHDYSVKFGLNVPLDVGSFLSQFEKEIKSSTNQQLLNFYLWYRITRRAIKFHDKVGSILTNKRNLDIHRSTQSADIIEIKVSEPSGKSEGNYYFNDLPDIGIKGACERFLELMKNMVSNSQKQFP